MNSFRKLQRSLKFFSALRRFAVFMAVFRLEDALSVCTNLGKHPLFVWLSVSGVKTGTRRTDPSRRTNEQLADIPASRKGVYLFRFSTNCSFFGRSISLGHYPSIYQEAGEGFIYFITHRTISSGERTKVVPVSFVDFFVFLVRNCQPAFYFIRHRLLQKIIFCFP